MGLDMFLYERRKREIIREQDLKTLNEITPDLGLEECPLGCVSVVADHEVGYWRKANSIHRWFVENVQGGVDDCGNYTVSLSELQLLKQQCQQVLDNPELAPDLLPSSDGFFFGSTDYSDRYRADLQDTVSIIAGVESTLAQYKLEGQHETPEFVYHSSW